MPKNPPSTTQKSGAANTRRKTKEHLFNQSAPSEASIYKKSQFLQYP